MLYTIENLIEFNEVIKLTNINNERFDRIVATKDNDLYIDNIEILEKNIPMKKIPNSSPSFIFGSAYLYIASNTIPVHR